MCALGLEHRPWEILCTQETRTDPRAEEPQSGVHWGRFQKGWEGGRKWHAQGRVTPPGSTTGSHTLGAGLHIQLLGTGDGSSSSVTVRSFPRPLRAGICTRMHTCTQSPHTCAEMHAHALTGRTQALHTLGGGEVAHFEDGCPGQAPRPCVQEAWAAYHPGRGTGALLPACGRWRHSREHQEESPIWLLSLSWEVGCQLLRQLGAEAWPLASGCSGLPAAEHRAIGDPWCWGKLSGEWAGVAPA